MRDVLSDIERWHGEGKRVAVATVIEAWGSSPRPVGSKMVVSDAGDMAGSVSGGCVEGAVFEEAQGSLRRGEPKLVTYGVSDETAWSVGLSCGGRIAIFITPWEPPEGGAKRGELFGHLARCLAEERLVAVATVVAGSSFGAQRLITADGETVGHLGHEELDSQADRRVGDGFASFASRCQTLEVAGEEVRVFLEILPPRPKLIVIGAVHVAVPLIAFAKPLGFRTIVVDPRSAFLTAERFAHADELCREWPDEALGGLGLNENTYIAVLSHDLKLDLPALSVALRHQVRYIGALGSKKTHGKRVTALSEAGFSEQQIATIHNPIGLPLGGRRAEEIALSIIAEIVAVGHGKALTASR